MSANSFDSKATLEVGGRSYEIYKIDALQSKYDVARLPFSLKILAAQHLQGDRRLLQVFRAALRRDDDLLELA